MEMLDLAEFNPCVHPDVSMITVSSSVAVSDVVRFVIASRDDILYQCSDQQTVVSGTRLVGPLADLQKAARQRYFVPHSP